MFYIVQSRVVLSHEKQRSDKSAFCKKSHTKSKVFYIIPHKYVLFFFFFLLGNSKTTGLKLGQKEKLVVNY